MKRIVVAALAALLLAPAAARADDITVTGTGDEDVGCAGPPTCPTLRSAYAAASQTIGADLIHVPAGVIQLTTFLTPADQTTTVGAGAGQTIIQGASTGRVVEVNGENTVALSSLTMRGGTDDGQGGGTLRIGFTATVSLDHVRITGGSATTGGGIFDEGAAQLTIAKSLIDGNTATGPGGGIESQGSSVSNPTKLVISDSTITGNAAGSGGGLDVNGDANASTTLQRVTVARNRADTGGAGINVVAGDSASIEGSIVALNGTDCGGPGALTRIGANVESGTSCGFSIENVDPGLGALSDAGGQTPVLPLASTSPAVDVAGQCAPAADQRDQPRPQGLACDAGAFELVPAPAPPPPAPTATPTPTPVPTPVAGTTVVAQETSGTVRVKRPGSNTFVELDGTQGIPVGSTIDTKHGVIVLTAQQTKGGAPQTAKFFDGIFKVTQTRATTDLTLTEALAKCTRNAHAAAKKPKTRKLWGSGSGSFRTRGQYSSATVRGTEWLVQDSCGQTLTRVKRGVVSVRDNVKRRTILLRAGKRYIARARRR